MNTLSQALHDTPFQTPIYSSGAFLERHQSFLLTDHHLSFRLGCLFQNSLLIQVPKKVKVLLNTYLFILCLDFNLALAFLKANTNDDAFYLS